MAHSLLKKVIMNRIGDEGASVGQSSATKVLAQAARMLKKIKPFSTEAQGQLKQTPTGRPATAQSYAPLNEERIIKARKTLAAQKAATQGIEVAAPEAAKPASDTPHHTP